MLSSVGANIVRASRSQNRQQTLPPRKQPGIIRIGFDVCINCFYQMRHSNSNKGNRTGKGCDTSG